MRLIVVRHGIATAKRRWHGPDADRPLTDHGARQAKAVGARLARYRPAEIISSPSLRCRQTVEPLAARTQTTVQDSDRMGIDAGARALELIHELVTTRPPASTVVVCTHREVLVEILPALAGEFGVAIDHRPPGAKGSYWTLRFRGDRLVNIKYARSDR
jgi:broad specificity phosphatase PhoE